MLLYVHYRYVKTIRYKKLFKDTIVPRDTSMKKFVCSTRVRRNKSAVVPLYGYSLNAVLLRIDVRTYGKHIR